MSISQIRLPFMKPTIKVLIFIIIAECLAPTSLFAKKNRRKKTPEKTEIKAEVIYRQVSVGHRRQSVYYEDNRSSDFVDQLYLTTRLDRSYDYRYQLVVEPAFYTVRDDATTDSFRIEQAYGVGQLTDSFQITAGRKVEFSGTGYFFNPSDLLFEDKNLLDPLEQRTGKNFTKFTFAGEESSFSIGYIREANNSFREGAGWLQFETFIGDADLLFQQTYSKDYKVTTGLSYAQFFTDSFELHFDGRYESIQRREKEYQLFSGLEEEEDSVYYVLGSRYVFSAKRTMILEWMQNTGGLAKEEIETYHLVLQQRVLDIAENKTNEKIPDPYTQTIGRRYVFTGYVDEETVKNWSFTGTYLRSLTDGSEFITVETKYNPSPIFSIGYAPTFFVGDLTTEFGQQPAHTAHYFVMKGTF